MKKFKDPNQEAEHILKILGKEPAFVNETLNEQINHYLFYSKRENFGICSHCGKLNTLDKVWEVTKEEYMHECWDAPQEMKKGSGAFICPDCQAQLQAYPYGYSRGKLSIGCRSNHWQRVGKTLYLITQLVDVDFKNEKAQFKKRPRCIYIYGKDGPRRLIYKEGWLYTTWEELKSFKFYFEPGFLGMSRYYIDILCNEPVDLLKGSYLDYAYDGEYESWCWELKERRMESYYPPADTPPPWIDCEYLGEFMRFPAIEVLHKTGFDYLIEQRLEEKTPKRALNWKATKLRKIFRNLNMKEIRQIRDYKCKLITIFNYQKLKKQGMSVSIPGLKKASETYYGLDRFEQRIGTERLAKSLDYLCDCNGTATEYFDYLEQCRLLGRDLEDKKVRYPKNLQAAHEAATAALQARRREYNKQKEKERKELFIMRIEDAFPKGYEWHSGGLLIRPALTPDELVKEGNCMRHCVGGYDKKVAAGESFIIFIRKENEPEQSFVTMECSPDFDLIQIRAKANRDPDEETKRVAARWLEEYKEEQKKWLKEKRKEIA